MANNSVFWNQLLMRSDSISEIHSDADGATEQILAQLSTITEQFDRTFDPADQFEEYVAVAFCQALARALTPPVAAPICKVAVNSGKIAAASGQTPLNSEKAPLNDGRDANKKKAAAESESAHISAAAQKPVAAKSGKGTKRNKSRRGSAK